MNGGIEVRGLTVRYDKFTLDASFTAPRGEVTGLIGENGAGKSTLMRAVAGITGYDGEVRINGVSARQTTRAERQKIGYVGNERNLPESLTLAAAEKALRGIFREWDRRVFFALAEKFALPSDLRIGEFSVGMKVKAALAAALSHGADTLLLDEPTSGLDPAARDEMLGEIWQFMQDERHTVLMTSHITSDLEKLCDRIVLLSGGRVLLSGEKDELLSRYAVVRGAAPGALRVIKREYGAESLVYARDAGSDAERVDLETLTVFFIKGREE